MKLFHNKVNQESLESINQVLLAGELGFGKNVSKFEDKFKEYSRKHHNCAVNSASAAAFIIYSYLKENHGVCDVYTSSLSFTSPAWAAVHFGHNIIWVDVNDDLLFDSKDYLKKRHLNKNNRKKVVMPVLYGGVSKIRDFDVLGDEFIFYDCAHCVTPEVESDVDIFSFHPYKPICSSDGGMISTNNKEIDDYSRSYRNFGRETLGNTYKIDKSGFKFYMNNLNASIAIESMNEYHKNLEIRKNNFEKLKSLFRKEIIIEHDEHSSFYFGTVITEKADYLNQKFKIPKHYPMLHEMNYYSKFHLELPNLERHHKNILNLPLYDVEILREVEIESSRS